MILSQNHCVRGCVRTLVCIIAIRSVAADSLVGVYVISRCLLGGSKSCARAVFEGREFTRVQTGVDVYVMCVYVLGRNRDKWYADRSLRPRRRELLPHDHRYAAIHVRTLRRILMRWAIPLRRACLSTWYCAFLRKSRDLYGTSWVKTKAKRVSEWVSERMKKRASEWMLR